VYAAASDAVIGNVPAVTGEIGSAFPLIVRVVPFELSLNWPPNESAPVTATLLVESHVSATVLSHGALVTTGEPLSVLHS
jgi:hypothetical protein